MATALARLRDYFQDDILVVQGKQMVATARGRSLAEPVRSMLGQLDELERRSRPGQDRGVVNQCLHVNNSTPHE